MSIEPNLSKFNFLESSKNAEVKEKFWWKVTLICNA